MKTALSQKFDVKDLGELHYFLGVQVAQDHNKGSLARSTNLVLWKYNISEAKPVKTPVCVKL